MQTNKSINTRSFTLFVCCDCGGGLSQDEVTILYIYMWMWKRMPKYFDEILVFLSTEGQQCK